ncbi:hypothetical protein PIB30_038816 [Stylosanthes scabra]|uniref:Uncharacterized protein n=1 Tax=Stylosanthes scabra TaxID=79078 RepID=A0ABU6RE86_9FABA|nr:hypothetical protein [Stylosanthes scabra]
MLRPLYKAAKSGIELTKPSSFSIFCILGPQKLFPSLCDIMALRRCSRKQAREDVRGEQADEAGPEAQAGQLPQEEEDLHRLNRAHNSKADLYMNKIRGRVKLKQKPWTLPRILHTLGRMNIKRGRYEKQDDHGEGYSPITIPKILVTSILTEYIVNRLQLP